MRRPTSTKVVSPLPLVTKDLASATAKKCETGPLCYSLRLVVGDWVQQRGRLVVRKSPRCPYGKSFLAMVCGSGTERGGRDVPRVARGRRLAHLRRGGLAFSLRGPLPLPCCRLGSAFSLCLDFMQPSDWLDRKDCDCCLRSPLLRVVPGLLSKLRAFDRVKRVSRKHALYARLERVKHCIFPSSV